MAFGLPKMCVRFMTITRVPNVSIFVLDFVLKYYSAIFSEAAENAQTVNIFFYLDTSGPHKTVPSAVLHVKQ